MEKSQFWSHRKKGHNATVVLSPEINNLITRIAEKEGNSKSFFIKMCIVEKLERLGLIVPPIKKEGD